MRADDDVHRAFFQAFQYFGRFFTGHKTRYFANANRPFGKAIRKHLVVLLSQKRGWCEHGDLLAAHRSDECSAQRNLGFAKANVAADQPIHRLCRNQIMRDGGNGAGLIGCGFKAKIVGEYFVIRQIQWKRVSLTQRTARV